MSREEISKVVKDLQSCAVAFQEGIRKANHLPHDYPKAEMEAIVEQIQAISGGDNDDLKVIIHLHDKLLQSIDAYASDDEPAATDHLRRLHGEVFIAAARFVKNIDPERVQAIARVVEPGKLVAGSADYHLAAQQLLSDVRAVLTKAERSNVIVQQYITNNSFSLFDLRNLQLALGGIRKACIGISIELSAKFLDLSWLSEFMKWLDGSMRTIASTCAALGELFRLSELGKILLDAISFSAIVVKQVGRLIESVVRSKKFERQHSIEERRADKDEYSGKSREELEAANRAKTAFLANLSHELRTPLNSIIGFTDVLKQEVYGPVGDERYKKYLDDLDASGLHILRVVNDVLDVSKIEMGRFPLDEEMFDVSELIAESMELMRPQIEKAGMRVEFDGGVSNARLFADRPQLMRVLLNVVSNSVKFCSKGGTVRVSSRIAEDGSLIIAVSDTGIGMSEQELAQVKRIASSAAASKYGGAGLGLPIAFSVVEQHGGRVEIKSRQHVGTTLAIHLPETRVHR